MLRATNVSIAGHQRPGTLADTNFSSLNNIGHIEHNRTFYKPANYGFEMNKEPRGRPGNKSTVVFCVC